MATAPVSQKFAPPRRVNSATLDPGLLSADPTKLSDMFGYVPPSVVSHSRPSTATSADKKASLGIPPGSGSGRLASFLSRLPRGGQTS
jgi:hypothetical protein